MMIKKIQQKKTIIFIFIIALLILSTPPLIRFISYDNTLIGDQAYYHQRIAKEINSDSSFSKDIFSYGGSDYIRNPYHFILALFASFISIQLVMVILPIILGMLSLLLFYKIMRLLKFKKPYTNISCFILAISPIFIYIFSYPNSQYIPFFLTLLITYLFLQKKKIWILAVVLSFLITFFEISHVLILFTLLTFLTIYKKELRKRLIFPTVILFFSSLTYYTPFLLQYGFPQRPDFITTNIFNSFITDFGALIAFSIFFLLMSLLGLIILKKKQENLPLFIISSITLVFSYYFLTLRFYINFLFVFMVSYAILQLLRRKWKLNFIKKMTLLAIICGLLFSTISYINYISAYPPGSEITESMNWLKEQPSGVVLSHYSNGFWIESLANKPTIMNSFFAYSPSVEERYYDSQSIFMSHQHTKTLELIDKYSIKYIWINQEMKQGQVWEKDNQGLLLILENSPQFKKIYSLNGVDIWTYLG